MEAELRYPTKGSGQASQLFSQSGGCQNYSANHSGASISAKVIKPIVLQKLFSQLFSTKYSVNQAAARIIQPITVLPADLHCSDEISANVIKPIILQKLFSWLFSTNNSANLVNLCKNTSEIALKWKYLGNTKCKRLAWLVLLKMMLMMSRCPLRKLTGRGWLNNSADPQTCFDLF